VIRWSLVGTLRFAHPTIPRLEIDMPKFALALIAAFAILHPLAASAAPNPKYCMSLRKHFDACESAQIAHHKPVKPTCSKYLSEMKKAGC
jgi:hypothetical protein